jgi:hypothetical protein
MGLRGILGLYIASCSDLEEAFFGVYVFDIDLLGSIFMCDLVQYPLGCLYVSRLFGSFLELL